MDKNGLFENENTSENSEYALEVEWYRRKTKPLWIPREGFGFYAPRSTVTKLTNADTLTALERYFEVKF
jgi:hypothetical protein